MEQVRISSDDLIMPYFVVEGRNKREAIKSMPGIYRFSIDNLIKEVKELNSEGIKSVILFGLSTKKDACGSQSYSNEGVLQKAIKAIKKKVRDITIISDVCLCAYTSHGHCGIVKMRHRSREEFVIDNDETLKILSKIALSHAQAGANFVAPSAMAAGQVKAVRGTLDKNGFQDTRILAYSAKYASNFYAPFREALNSQPQFGDRSSYQLDFRNSDQALREIEQDIDEGADIIMVKPALAYLDIIRRAKEKFNVPVAAYNVSGEYSLVKFAVKKGIFSAKDLVLEILTAIKRSGADLIITYHAKEVANWIKGNQI